jgi:hypothetical protein
MFFSNTLHDTDVKGLGFCAACRQKMDRGISGQASSANPMTGLGPLAQFFWPSGTFRNEVCYPKLRLAQAISPAEARLLIAGKERVGDG